MTRTPFVKADTRSVTADSRVIQDERDLKSPTVALAAETLRTIAAIEAVRFVHALYGSAACQREPSRFTATIAATSSDHYNYRPDAHGRSDRQL